MSDNREKLVYIFNSTRLTMRADSLLGLEGVERSIIPVPRSISAKCGMCIEAPKNFELTIEASLEEHGIAFEKFERYAK